jgi:hypothetical protein
MEARLVNREWLAGQYTFADIAWRERMTLRPAVMPVVAAMAGYLSSQRRPVPPWLAAAVRSKEGRQS